jgi:ABC-type transporter Mla MlaB component
MRPADDSKKSPRPAGSSMTPPNRLATYDHFGQTLIVTLTVNTLSGPDAIELVQEVSGKLKAEAANGSGAGRRPRRGEEPPVSVRHIVLDLQNVQYMDSGCIGVLVELMTRLQNAGGRIALVNADPNVEYLFKLTRLDRLFPICRDVMRAIDAVERAA